LHLETHLAWRFKKGAIVSNGSALGQLIDIRGVNTGLLSPGHHALGAFVARCIRPTFVLVTARRRQAGRQPTHNDRTMENPSCLPAYARRGLAAICALSLVFALSACGGDDDDTDEPAPAPPTTTPTTPCAVHCAP
jgi:hypothetical protein